MATSEFATMPQEVRDFRPRCPGCTPALVTEAEARPCSSFDCPGLPKRLEVTCDLCMYDFAANDGQIKCDHTTCESALRLQGNVEVYRAWVEMLRAELAAAS